MVGTHFSANGTSMVLVASVAQRMRSLLQGSPVLVCQGLVPLQRTREAEGVNSLLTNMSLFKILNDVAPPPCTGTSGGYSLLDFCRTLTWFKGLWSDGRGSHSNEPHCTKSS